MATEANKPDSADRGPLAKRDGFGKPVSKAGPVSRPDPGAVSSLDPMLDAGTASLSGAFVRPYGSGIRGLTALRFSSRPILRRLNLAREFNKVSQERNVAAFAGVFTRL